MLSDLFALRGWFTEWDDLLLEPGAVVWAYRAIVPDSWARAPAPFHPAIIRRLPFAWVTSPSSRDRFAILSTTRDRTPHPFVIQEHVEPFATIPGNVGRWRVLGYL